MPELPSHSDLIPYASQDGTTLTLRIVGEIDLHNSPDLRTSLLALLQGATYKKLVVNLGKVPYMDSSAIAVLVEMLQKLRKNGGKVLLTDLQPRVKGLLEIARLESIFGVCKDEEEARTK